MHIADIHLGYRQYGSEERSVDFAQAFMKAIKFAIEKKVDFILIAGDLFHKKNEMDPVTLTQAMKVLEKAAKAGIPVIAVEGNHDSAYFRETYSWIDYLAQNGMLVNLKPFFDDGIVVDEWDGVKGAYIDLAENLGFDVRIYGMKYYGSMTEKVLEAYSKKVKKKGFTIFMAHAGIEGYVKVCGCVSSNLFHKLNVDYVALGHIHKSFVEGKIHNPGSLEVCDITELSYDRGLFYVEYGDDVDICNESDNKNANGNFIEIGDINTRIKTSLVKIPGREFVTITHELKDKSLKSFKNKISKIKADKPVVYINIKCPKNVRRFVEDEDIKKIVRSLNPIVTKIKWEIEDDTFNPIFRDRADIELCVMRQILENYGYSSIVSDVIRLKDIFQSSFDLRRLDEFIGNLVEIKLTNSAKNSTVCIDKEKSFEEIAKNQVKINKIDRKSINKIDKLSREETKETKKSEKESEEEVWNWRAIYDTGSKPRKR